MKLFGACISTHNISNMVEFYSAIFDCEPHVDGPDHQFHNAQLILFQLDDTNTPSTKNSAMVYSVNDVDAEYLRLNNKGIASSPTLTKLAKGESANMEIVVRICTALKCDLHDIVEIVPDEANTDCGGQGEKT